MFPPWQCLLFKVSTSVTCEISLLSLSVDNNAVVEHVREAVGLSHTHGFTLVVGIPDRTEELELLSHTYL